MGTMRIDEDVNEALKARHRSTPAPELGSVTKLANHLLRQALGLIPSERPAVKDRPAAGARPAPATTRRPRMQQQGKCTVHPPNMILDGWCMLCDSKAGGG